MSIHAKFQIKKGTFTLNADLNIPAKAITSIFGKSGSGKTTLLRAIAGLDFHKNGYIRIGETVWQDKNIFVPPHKRAIGYVFQEPGLFRHLSVIKNIEYGQKRSSNSKNSMSPGYIIDLLNIKHLLDRQPQYLSGGEQQRVAIARALAYNPDLLLMDEPLSSLDENLKLEILPYIQSLHTELKIPIIYVSHSTDEVARIADHIVILEEGIVKASGLIGEILTSLDFNISRDENAESLVEAIVMDHDNKFSLTYLDSEFGKFTVGQKNLPIGTKVRLRIAARDVSITLAAQTGTSILNIFPAQISKIAPVGRSQVMVKLVSNKASILARVTRKSANILDLAPNKKVYVQVKSVALLA
ncbi:MAG: molybdenum ABC transporter ATP-binding protein [Melioribacteraceae bacterium]|nr:molybdenum ABC transporter ATP-binding protein [Melioribacteraceae bacterium]